MRAILQKFSLITLGCKVNQYDGQDLARRLVDDGWSAARPGEPADLLVVCTCCLTATAMRKCRQAITRGVAHTPGAAVVVAGCYSDYDGQRISQLLTRLGIPPERALVGGHHDRLPQRLTAFARRLTTKNDASEASTARGGGWPAGQGDGVTAAADFSGKPASDTVVNPSSIKQRRAGSVKANVPAQADLGRIGHFAGHQRAFVKVQDGCDAFCSYCIVPYTRCHVASKRPADVLTECRDLVASGHRELILSGVFLGAYGRTTTIRRHWPAGEPAALPALLAAVADIEGLWRVRLSSLEPGDLDAELLAVMRDHPNVAPHLHLPLQSGSADVLQRMNRQYTADDFCRTIDAVRSSLDRPAITTDIIVGFPGETEEDFAATLEMARHAGFAKIHAFPFSAVEPTAAWQMRKEAPPATVVREQLARLGELEREMAEEYRRQFVGQAVEALVEGPTGPRRRAMTDRYQRVDFRAGSDGPQPGEVIRLNIQSVTADGLSGTLASNQA